MGPSLRSSPESITSSISCTPREPSSIGTSERVWRKGSSPRPERILPPLRRITRRSVSRSLKVKVRKKAWSDQLDVQISLGLTKLIEFPLKDNKFYTDIEE